MVDKWLHIEELSGDPWVLPIWSSVNDAVQKGKINSLPNEVYELGVYISTRLNILPRIVKRINADVEELFIVAGRHEESNVFTKTKEGNALRINNDLKYNIICDIDSLLFEINSVCELITKLFESLYSHAGKPLKKQKIGLKIKSIIENAKQNSSWFSDLVGHRNFFIHEATPYIAIDISNGPNNYELLIMRENLKNFEDKEKFMTISELNEIVQGFLNSKSIIQDDLAKLFKAIYN
jgi:hypothetical protein